MWYNILKEISLQIIRHKEDSMKHLTKKFAAMAAVIMALTAISGCKAKQDIDLSLIGGEMNSESSSYTVDIVADEPTAEEQSSTAPAPETEDVPEPAPEPPAATTVPAPKPAVTITTDKPKVTTPAQTVRTDLPKVTAEPQYTAPATTTAKPAQTEPAEIETDSNGFPANPEVNQYFVDSTGQEYIYDSIFGWIKGNNGSPTVVEFPSFEVDGGDEIILY